MVSMNKFKAAIRKKFDMSYRNKHLKNIDSVESIKNRRNDYDKLIDKIRNSGTNSLDHFKNSYAFEGGLRLQQNPDEFASLCLFLQENKPYNNYLEIGSASGGTCLFLEREIGFGNKLIIDDGNHPDAKYQMEHFKQMDNYIRHICDSHTDEARTFIEDNLDGKLDLVFIDGDHSFEGAWQDVVLVLPFCREGTILVFHDTIACPGVEKVWLDSIKKKTIEPLAEYIGDEMPLGIGIGKII